MILTPCIIFAGGKSSRMGEDKALLPFANFPTLAQYQYERLKKIFQNVYISTKDAKKFDFDAPFIEDISEELTYAPTTGFVSVFDALHGGDSIDINEIFVLSVDTPFIGKEEIKKIFNAYDEKLDAVVATTQDTIHPLCGIYNKRLHSNFENMLLQNQHKLSKLLHDSKTLFVNFENPANFLNLNYPDDYQEALLRLQVDGLKPNNINK